MKKSTAIIVLATTAAILLYLGDYYCFNFLHYASVGAPAVAKAVPPADCTIENPTQIDFRAEASRIEALAAVVTPNWTRVQTDTDMHAKAVELADTLHRLKQSNYVSCHSFESHDGYTSLTFCRRSDSPRSRPEAA